MKEFIIKYKLALIGIAAGAIGGWSYAYFVGCTSGSCAITSSPINSAVYFGIVGGALLHTFAKDNEEKTENNLNN